MFCLSSNSIEQRQLAL